MCGNLLRRVPLRVRWTSSGSLLPTIGRTSESTSGGDSTLEQDFFARTAKALIPIEVKAKNGTEKSIRTLIASEKYEDIHCGIKFTGGNIGFNDNIYTFPYFCTFLLKRYLAEAEL